MYRVAILSKQGYCTLVLLQQNEKNAVKTIIMDGIYFICFTVNKISKLTINQVG